jgi:hypothetical protein
VASVGTSGQVLTSNGAGALPTFQAAGGGGGAPYAMARITQSGGTYTIIQSSGFASLIKNGVGNIELEFTVHLANDTHAMPVATINQSNQRIAFQAYNDGGFGVVMQMFDPSGNPIESGFNIIVYQL